MRLKYARRKPAGGIEVIEITPVTANAAVFRFIHYKRDVKRSNAICSSATQKNQMAPFLIIYRTGQCVL